MKKDKPPLGIMPRSIWQSKIRQERSKEILQAMVRYKEAGKAIPQEWIKELMDLEDAAENDKETQAG